MGSERAEAWDPVAGVSDEHREVLHKVAEMLGRIDFGTIVLVIHDGKVVQVEMAEKFRLR